MTDVRAVLFDAGGTLVLQHPSRLGELIEVTLNAEDCFVAHYLTMAEFSAAKSRDAALPWEWWLERYFTRLGLPQPHTIGPAIRGGYGLWMLPIPGAVEAVARLAEAGVRVAVVSNSDGSVRESLADAGFGDVFEFVIDSHEEGVSKPDPEIFRRAVERLGLTPGEVWYAGDSPYHDVAGARAAGLGGAWLVDPLDLHRGDHRISSVAVLPELVLAQE